MNVDENGAVGAVGLGIGIGIGIEIGIGIGIVERERRRVKKGWRRRERKWAKG